MGAKFTPLPSGTTAEVTAIGDASLVERARAGDRQAEALLYKRYALLVLNTTGRLLRNKQDAFDVSQDAFIHAFDKLDQLRDPSKFKSWILRAAVMRARGLLRRRQMKRRLGFDTPVDPAAHEALAPASSSPEVRAQLRMVFKILQRLPTEHQLAWSLRKIEGYKLREVASLGGWSLSSTVRYIDAADARIKAEVQLGEHDDE